MEKYSLNTAKQPENKILDSQYAKMVLDKALRDFRIEQLHKEIDQSLQNRDKEAFHRLTEELIEIS